MRSVFRETEHMFRMGGLFVIGIVLFFVLRAVMMPPDFGKYGHYRPGALDDAMARPVHFAGAVACADCHDDKAAAKAAGKHKGVHCEACHGAQAAHAADPTADPIALPAVTDLCTRCHARSSARPAWFPQVDPEEHAQGEECNACHDPHDPGF